MADASESATAIPAELPAPRGRPSRETGPDLDPSAAPGRRLRVQLRLPARGRADRRDAAGASAALRPLRPAPAGSPASTIAPPMRTTSRRALSFLVDPADRRPVRPRERPRGGGRRRQPRRQRDHRHRDRHRDQGQCRQSRGAAGRAGAGSRPGSPAATCAGASGPGSTSERQAPARADRRAEDDDRAARSGAGDHADAVPLRLGRVRAGAGAAARRSARRPRTPPTASSAGSTFSRSSS